jgi:hypothetical protein
MKFDRYRAYAASEGTKSAHSSVEDDEGVVTKERNVVQSWPTESVAYEGESSGNGDTAEFNSGKIEITRITFYRGDVETERCVGSVDVGKAGKISVKCPDRVKGS